MSLFDKAARFSILSVSRISIKKMWVQREKSRFFYKRTDFFLYEPVLRLDDLYEHRAFVERWKTILRMVQEILRYR